MPVTISDAAAHRSLNHEKKVFCSSEFLWITKACAFQDGSADIDNIFPILYSRLFLFTR